MNGPARLIGRSARSGRPRTSVALASLATLAAAAACGSGNGTWQVQLYVQGQGAILDKAKGTVIPNCDLRTTANPSTSGCATVGVANSTASIDLTAQPGAGWTFDRWRGCPTATTDLSSTSVTLQRPDDTVAPEACTAVFLSDAGAADAGADAS
jgi:hypothetical protein